MKIKKVNRFLFVLIIGLLASSVSVMHGKNVKIDLKDDMKRIELVLNVPQYLAMTRSDESVIVEVFDLRNETVNTVQIVQKGNGSLESIPDQYFEIISPAKYIDSSNVYMISFTTASRSSQSKVRIFEISKNTISYDDSLFSCKRIVSFLSFTKVINYRPIDIK